MMVELNCPRDFTNSTHCSRVKDSSDLHSHWMRFNQQLQPRSNQTSEALEVSHGQSKQTQLI